MEKHLYFDYYGTRESRQYAFYRIPKVLFTEACFQPLSTEAKFLYGIMLDRMALSAKSGWVDEENHVYIYFSNAEIRDCLQCGHSKATKLTQELEKIGLIQKKRQGQCKPDRIYVMNFVSAQDAELETAEMQSSENETSDNRTSKIQPSGMLNFSVPDVQKSAPNNTDSIKTDRNNTDLPPSSPHGSRDPPDDYEKAKMELREKWGYISLIDSYPRETIDNLILLGADVLCSKNTTIRVGKESLPAQRVRDRLLSLDMTHIDYVLETFFRSSAQIYNTRAYLLTALYNAPTTIDAYYTALYHRNEGKN